MYVCFVHDPYTFFNITINTKTKNNKKSIFFLHFTLEITKEQQNFLYLKPLKSHVFFRVQDGHYLCLNHTHTQRHRNHKKKHKPTMFFNRRPFPFKGAVKHEFPACLGPSICPWGPLRLCSDGLWHTKKLNTSGRGQKPHASKTTGSSPGALTTLM